MKYSTFGELGQRRLSSPAARGCKPGAGEGADAATGLARVQRTHPRPGPRTAHQGLARLTCAQGCTAVCFSLAVFSSCLLREAPPATFSHEDKVDSTRMLSIVLSGLIIGADSPRAPFRSSAHSFLVFD